MRVNRLFIGACAALLAIGARAQSDIVVHGLFKDRAIITVRGKQHLLTVGKPTPEGIELISADSQSAVLEVDGERKTYTLGTHISSTYTTPGPGTRVRIWPDVVGMYVVDGSINGFPTRFLVDTGATLVAMNRNVARRLGIEYKLDGREGTTTTASGVTRAYYVELDKVRIGDIELHDIRAAVIDGDYPNEVLLGNSFLGRLDMARDGRVLELRSK